MIQTIYTPDVANNKLHVEREFNGAIEKVWRAWTESELLEQWWAPLPYKAVTKKMDFREGGYWHYYMLGPDGSKFWCMAHYCEIDPLKRFTCDDEFCDEEGKKNNELPGMLWDVRFSPTKGGTKVDVKVSFASQADMEKIVEMGFEEGFSAAHENLDELLKR